MEQQLKQILGEYAFTIAFLQNQVETLKLEIEKLKKEENENALT